MPHAQPALSTAVDQRLLGAVPVRDRADELLGARRHERRDAGEAEVAVDLVASSP